MMPDCRSTQRLVHRRHDSVAVLEGTRHSAGRHEATDVRHIRHPRHRRSHGNGERA